MQDVLKEAEQYSNQVLVADESDDFQVVERWEPVTEVDVQTPLDVYRELRGEQKPMDGCCQIRLHQAWMVLLDGVMSYL